VTIPIPENGQPFPTTCTVNGTGYQYQTGTIEWKKLVENGHWNNVSENDRYYSGTAYKVYLILSATDDNRFYDTDFHAVINGQEASVYQKSDKSVTIYTTFEPKLCVGGTQVTSANCGDVLGDGKVSYDMTSKVLTLNGATISGTGSTSAASTGYGSAIYSMIDGLTIQVTGNNQLTGKTNCHGLYLSGTTTITSQTGGSLTTTGYTGAYLLEGMLIIGGNVTLNATGQGGGGLLGGFGYNGGYEYYATLCIRDKATVNAREDWYGSIAMWKALQLLDGRAIITPSDAVWDGHGVRDADGNYVSSQVTIGAKNFGLKIAGTKVTGNNMTDVLGDGHFRYYENDNTLRIMGNNSTTSDNYHFIENDIPGLTIAVMEAKISARKSAIFSKTDLTIKGGYLTLSSTGDCGIWMEKGAKLTICDIDRLEVENSWYGICGSMNNTLESLHIENAQVVINSTYDAVCDFTGGITLSGCSIIEPVNGRIYKGAIVDQNTIVAKTVLIDAVIPTEISKPSSLNDQGDLYMIDGRKVNAEGALPKGIYIRNGKKILK